MELKHCSTDNMIDEFYTKSLQGKNYYKLRNIIMGLSTMPLKESVGISNKKTTDIHTIKSVTKKYSNKVSNQQYRLSSNFD